MASQPPPYSQSEQGPPPPGFQVPGGYPPQGYFQPGYPPNYPGAPPPQQGYPPNYPPPQGYPPSQGYPYNNIYGNQPAQGMYGSNYGNESGEEVSGFNFSDKSIRQGFIRKVYGILTCQLVVTTAFVAFCAYHQPTKAFLIKNSWLSFVALIVAFVLIIVMSCCGEVRRRAPGNFVCLAIFTMAEMFMLGTFASSYRSEEVVFAAGITALVCFALSIFAFQTKWDFTIMGGGLFAALIILMIFGIICIFIPGKTVQIIYSAVAALIFSLYLIYDTQLMIGGKHKYALSPEEYIFAALNLYIDVIEIFLSILSIIGRTRD